MVNMDKDFMKSSVIIFLIIFVFSLVGCKEESSLYNQAMNFASNDKRDFAYMYFNKIVTNFPESKYFKNSLYAIAEYYFMLGDFSKANESFWMFIEKYPQDKNVPFAYAYLLKIAKSNKEEKTQDYIEKEVISLKQFSLLFRESKEFKYLSPFYREHKIVYSINKIEFYIDGELFEEILF